MHRIESSIFNRLNILLNLKQSILFNSYISPRAKIGKRVKFAHAYGIVIGQATIGDDVIIFQQVTIGSHGNFSAEKAWPIIGNKCKIYSGAKILGGVRVGDNCTIGANCVIMKDLPDNSIVMSAPSKVIGYNE